jgi:DNA repair photolyase
MRVHHYRLKTGITRTPEFEKKGLATHAVNVGTKCGHGCLYCSTGAVLRTHRSFRDCAENPFKFGYAIVDPTTPERVAKDAQRIQKRGLVQLCTLTDAWAPEARRPTPPQRHQGVVWRWCALPGARPERPHYPADQGGEGTIRGPTRL